MCVWTVSTFEKYKFHRSDSGRMQNGPCYRYLASYCLISCNSGNHCSGKKKNCSICSMWWGKSTKKFTPSPAFPCIRVHQWELLVTTPSSKHTSPSIILTKKVLVRNQWDSFFNICDLQQCVGLEIHGTAWWFFILMNLEPQQVKNPIREYG